MLCARDPAALVGVVLELLAIGADEESDLPPMRAGAALGEVVRRGGDYFGHVVNVASRLTDVAEPHSLVVEQHLYEAARASATWKAGGSHALRGVEQPVGVHVASAVDSDNG
jgi:adenylate cyclase